MFVELVGNTGKNSVNPNLHDGFMLRKSVLLESFERFGHPRRGTTPGVVEPHVINKAKVSKIPNRKPYSAKP